jgi:signal transduction histidine kinase
MAKSADDVLAKFQTYGLALLACDEGGDDGEGELLENIDSARGDLQESLVDLRSMVYEFRKRAAKSR